MAKKSSPRKANAPSKLGSSAARIQAQSSNEIEDFPARLLADLPLPVALWLEVPGSPVPVCFTTAAETREEEGVLASAVVFHRQELTALVTGAESERMWHKELVAFCFDKWRRPALRITQEDALAGANASVDVPAWSLRRLLERLGATLVRVELAHEPHMPSERPISFAA